jgi:hypothetical protein
MLLTMIVVSKQKPPGETNLLKLLRRWHGLTQCAARLQPAERNGSNAFCGSTIPKKHRGLRSGSDIALTRAPAKIPLRTIRETPSFKTAMNR